MQMAQDISSLVLSIRKNRSVNIKVRQPLQKILIPVSDASMKEQLKKVEELILSEVNVKEAEYLDPDNQFIRKRIKPNFVALGKKMGPLMKQVSAALGAYSQDDIRALERNGRATLHFEQESVDILLEEVDIQSEDVPGWMVAVRNGLTVALDITLTDALVQEGLARELVNRIQKLRKDNGLQVTDRIHVKLKRNDQLVPSISQFNTYICAEILADSLEFVPELSGGVDIDVNEIPLSILVEKKG
jgi:isoleucyl-tRNA synthetase